MRAKGKLIAAVGLPGSGKSAIIGRAASICAAACFLEPEESEWPDAVHLRERVGYATAITWFRAVRIPKLYEAQSLCGKGHTVFVDSYYDKLLCHYLGRRGMEWLIPPDDPYFPILERMAMLDYETLPDADCVVSFKVSEERWRTLMGARSRRSDERMRLYRTYDTQALYIDSAAAYCASRGAVHVLFDNDCPGIGQAARQLVLELKNRGVLEDSPP